MKLYFVTSNQDKVIEFNRILSGKIEIEHLKPEVDIEELEDQNIEKVVVDKIIGIGIGIGGMAIPEVRIGKWAKEEAKKSRLPGERNGPQDAYRHCLWNCVMTEEVGETRAKIAGSIYEAAGSRVSGHPDEAQMDLHNNEVGRNLGKKCPTIKKTEKQGREECKKGCMRALRRHELKIIEWSTMD